MFQFFAGCKGMLLQARVELFSGGKESKKEGCPLGNC